MATQKQLSDPAADSTRPRVALCIETSNAYARGLLRGIHRFLQEHDSWSIYRAEQGRGNAPPRWLKNWQGDGIIARIENQQIADVVLATGLPVIDVSAARLLPKLPWVETDDELIAELAARHLLERGLRHFAFCGDDAFNWSCWRRDRFAKVIQAAGFTCSVFKPEANAKSRTAQAGPQTGAALARWIEALRKPVGIMACYDELGVQVLNTCRQMNLHVPDEVAVVGVDNDELLCNLSDPPLSSVEPDAPRIGYEAAELLAKLLSGVRVSPGTTLRIAPKEVVARRSTDVFAVDDEDVRTAMRFIRQHACNGIKVEDVLAVVSVSRSVLESKFTKLVGRTPHDEIARVRLDRVANLLTHSDLTLSQIAERTGFRHVEYLSVAFKNHTGVSPTAFRQGSARPK